MKGHNYTVGNGDMVILMELWVISLVWEKWDMAILRVCWDMALLCKWGMAIF